MKCNRIVGLVLLVAVLGVVFPAVGEAGVAAGAGDAEGFDALSLLSRIYAAVQGWLSGLAERFVAAQGATPTGNGCPNRLNTTSHVYSTSNNPVSSGTPFTAMHA